MILSLCCVFALLPATDVISAPSSTAPVAPVAPVMVSASAAASPAVLLRADVERLAAQQVLESLRVLQLDTALVLSALREQAPRSASSPREAAAAIRRWQLHLMAGDQPAQPGLTPQRLSASDAAQARVLASALLAQDLRSTIRVYALDPLAIAERIDALHHGRSATVAVSPDLVNRWREHLTNERRRTNDAWLAEHAQLPGVAVTATGLHYEILARGATTATAPLAGDQVSVRYRGTLPNGTVFDESGETPATFAVRQLIPAWQEALQLMRPGDTWRICVPPQLGYGDQGVPSSALIGPAQILLFELTLIDIVR